MNPSQIKEQIDAFAKTEYETFKQKMSEQFQMLQQNLNDNLNKQLMSTVGEDLYDYPEYPINKLSNIPNLSDILIAGEVQIIGKRFDLQWQNRNASNRFYQMITVTNYSRIFVYRAQCKSGVYTSWDECYPRDRAQYTLNFWIPKDYIHIIRTLLNQTANLKGSGYFIIDLLKHLKENLINGTYVKNKLDIHYMDVYKRQQELDAREKCITEASQEQKRTMDQQNKILDARNTALDKKLQRHRLIAKKISIERAKLKKAKEEFEELQLEKIDLDDLIEDKDDLVEEVPTIPKRSFNFFDD